MDPDEYKKDLENKALAAMGGMGLLSSVLGYTAAQENAKNDEFNINRTVQAQQYFKDIDPRLKNLYLQRGSKGLENYAGDILKELIPSTTSPFVPADLSLAGKYREALENIESTNNLTNNITVTPGPNPARFATPELTPAEIGKGGSKGYIWGNPDEPQWGYARGNLNRKAVTTTNPTLYMTKLDLDPEKQGPFNTTGEVVRDPALIENRQWGQRSQYYGGDLYFPKENIKARGEVTAADLYTKIKNYGFESGPLTDVNRPDEYFQHLAETLAKLEGTPERPAPIKQVLENIATPVPPLGISEREHGAVPVLKEFDVLGATPEQKTKAGINKIFLDPTNVDFAAAHFSRPVTVNNKEVRLAVPDSLNKPSTFAGRSFGNINPLKTGGFIAGALYSPEIFKDIEKKQYASAAAKAGAAAAAGTVMEGAIRTGVVNAARAGIAWPARALAAANPVVAAISTATLAPGSSRITPRQEAYENQLRETKFKQAEAARQRGGKWTFPTPFGKIKIPELGISESGGLFFR
jgi:hypothetical protein